MDSTFLGSDSIVCSQIYLRKPITRVDQACTKKYVDSSVAALERVRIVSVSSTLLATDNVVFVQNAGVAISLSIPNSIEEISITRSVGSTGTITLIFVGGTIESLAGTFVPSTTLAAISAFGSGVHYRKDPSSSTRLLRIR